MKKALILLSVYYSLLFFSVSSQVNENKHSPHKATFYSAILPGLGQAINKKYWKIPVIYAGIGAFGYVMHFNTSYYEKYKSAYRDWLINDPNNKSYLEFIPPNKTEEQIKKEHSTWFENMLASKNQYYRRYKELSYIGMGTLYFLQIVDAAVDAHFYNFNISDDLSFSIYPTAINTDYAPSIGLQIKIKLN